MPWSKDSRESLMLEDLQRGFLPLLPKFLRKDKGYTYQTFPNRATHLGALIEWAVAKGYTLALVKPNSTFIAGTPMPKAARKAYRALKDAVALVNKSKKA